MLCYRLLISCLSHYRSVILTPTQTDTDWIVTDIVIITEKGNNYWADRHSDSEKLIRIYIYHTSTTTLVYFTGYPLALTLTQLTENWSGWRGVNVDRCRWLMTHDSEPWLKGIGLKYILQNSNKETKTIPPPLINQARRLYTWRLKTRRLDY